MIILLSRILQRMNRKNYAAFDFEWTEDGVIDAVSFVDNDGNSEVKFRQRDFAGSESDLLRYVMAKLIHYKWSMGWNTQGNSNNAGGNNIT